MALEATLKRLTIIALSLLAVVGLLAGCVDTSGPTPQATLIDQNGDLVGVNLSGGSGGGTGPAGPQGPQGPQGPSGPTGATGATGDNGTAATITVGSTTTGLPGTDATVVNSGTTSAAILDFTIPRGDKGDQGDPGTPGSPGSPGAPGSNGQGYTNRGAWVSSDNYSAYDVLTDGGQTFECYLGLNNSTTAPASDTSHFQIWAQKGSDGAPGAPGSPGSPGPNVVSSNTTTAFTDVLVGNSGNVTQVAQGTAGQVLTSNGSGVPTYSTILLPSTLIYYFQDTASDVASAKKQLAEPYTPKTTALYSGVTTGLVQTFATDPGIPGVTHLPAGSFEFHIHARVTTGGMKPVQLYAEIWECDASGGDIAKIGTSETSVVLTTSEAEYREYFTTANVYTMAATTSRVKTKIYATVGSTGSSPDVDLYWGDEADSHIALPTSTSPADDDSAYGTGNVTSVSVASANGFGGTVANASTTPAITITTNVTGILKGNGTGVSPAAAADIPGYGIVPSGATMPVSPVEGQLFLQDTTGRRILSQYDGANWQALRSYGTITVYVSTTGTDDLNHGTGTGSNAFLTIAYAIAAFPQTMVTSGLTIYAGAGTFAGDITINKGGFFPYPGLSIIGSTTQLLSTTATGGIQGSGPTTYPYVTGTFTANQYNNKIIHFTSGTNSGTYRIIGLTTTTKLYIEGTTLPAVPLNGDTYEILNWATIITGKVNIYQLSGVTGSDDTGPKFQFIQFENTSNSPAMVYCQNSFVAFQYDYFKNDSSNLYSLFADMKSTLIVEWCLFTQGSTTTIGTTIMSQEISEVDVDSCVMIGGGTANGAALLARCGSVIALGWSDISAYQIAAQADSNSTVSFQFWGGLQALIHGNAYPLSIVQHSYAIVNGMMYGGHKIDGTTDANTNPNNVDTGSYSYVTS